MLSEDELGRVPVIYTGIFGVQVFRNFQAVPGAHPASHSMGTGSSIHGVKRPGREAHHSPQSSVNS